MSGSSHVHDPNEVQDYGVDWASQWLRDTETITGYTVTVTGATKISDGLVGSQTVARVTGGTVGDRAKVLHHVVASSGRECDLTQTLYIRQK